MLHGSQRLGDHVLLLFLGCLATGSTAMGVSISSGTNFTAMASDARLADKVVEKAEHFRSRIAAGWLGGSLPASRRPAVLYVKVDETRSFARTLPNPSGEGHLVWLVGSREAVTGALLEHELVHVAFATRFGNGLPRWANEGVASGFDNQRRHELRQQQLAGFVDIDSWPHLDRLLMSEIREPWQYAAAVSLTDYLVQRGGREHFLAFAVASKTDARQALEDYYGFESLEALQTAWQRAVRDEMSPRRLAATAPDRADSSARFVR